MVLILRNAFKTVFANKNYYYILIISAIIFQFINMAIPITFTPGHSISFFFEITEWHQWLVMITFSILMGIIVSLQVYVWKNLKGENLKKKLGTGAPAIFSFLVSAATCLACSVSLLTLILPVAGMIFIVQYLWYVITIGIILALLSIYMTSYIIIHHCERCVY